MRWDKKPLFTAINSCIDKLLKKFVVDSQILFYCGLLTFIVIRFNNLFLKLDFMLLAILILIIIFIIIIFQNHINKYFYKVKNSYLFNFFFFLYFNIKDFLFSIFFEFNNKNNSFSRSNSILLVLFFSLFFGCLIFLIINNQFFFNLFLSFNMYLNFFSLIETGVFKDFYASYPKTESNILTYSILQQKMNIKSSFKLNTQLPYIQKRLIIGETRSVIRIFIDWTKTKIGAATTLGATTVAIGTTIYVDKKTQKRHRETEFNLNVRTEISNAQSSVEKIENRQVQLLDIIAREEGRVKIPFFTKELDMSTCKKKYEKNQKILESLRANIEEKKGFLLYSENSFKSNSIYENFINFFY